MEIRLYNFDKKKNSTRQPTEGNVERGVLKNPSSVSNPRIEFNGSSMGGNPTNYNYAFIAEFNRYYFIKEWSYESALWVAEMECDVLASFKADIVAQNYYILRTSTAFDGDLRDNLYPLKPVPEKIVTKADSELFQGVVSDFMKGSFVVGITGSDGMASYWVMNYTSFTSFSKKIFSSTNWLGDVSSIGEDIAKMVFNPSQYITSILWFPFKIKPTSNEVNIDLQIGYWKVPIKALGLFNKELTETYITAVTIPDHPQINRGKFLNSFPYRNVKISLPGLGILELDAGKIQSGVVSVEVTADLTTGIAVYHVLDANTGFILANMTGKIGFSLDIGDIKSGIAEAINTVAVGALQAVAGNPAGGAMRAAMSFHDILKNDVSTVSSADSFATMTYLTKALTTFYKIAEEDNADNGRPYMKNGSPSTMGEGYYIVENGNIAITRAYSEEKDEIKNYLERGWYYE